MFSVANDIRIGDASVPQHLAPPWPLHVAIQLLAALETFVYLWHQGCHSVNRAWYQGYKNITGG